MPCSVQPCAEWGVNYSFLRSLLHSGPVCLCDTLAEHSSTAPHCSWGQALTPPTLSQALCDLAAASSLVIPPHRQLSGLHAL